MIGSTAYELNNHLGNILATISDKKIGHSTDGTTVDYYTAEVLNQTDYYSFGMTMPGRKYGGAGRYGFNGKEDDKEVAGQQDYGMRFYDKRLGRFKSVDPLTDKYPELTPYQFASNRPIDGVDLDGMEYLKKIPKFDYTENRWNNYVTAIDNGAINVINTVPGLWNSLVSTVQSIGRGTYFSGLGNEAKQTGQSIKQTAVNTYDYTFGTSVKQQFIDAGKTLTEPKTLEFAATLYLGAKVPLNLGKGLPSKEVSSVVKAEAVAAKGGNSSAHLATEGANLSRHLGQLEKYGQAGFKEL